MSQNTRKRPATKFVVVPANVKRARVGTVAPISTQTQRATKRAPLSRQVEIKQRNFGLLSQQWTDDGDLTMIAPIEAGDGAAQRNGRVIRLESLSFRTVHRVYQTGVANNTVRYIIGLWKGQNVPSPDDILSTFHAMSGYDVGNSGEYKILYDKYHTFNARVFKTNNDVETEYAPQDHVISGNIKLGMLQKYSSDAGDSAIQPRLFQLVLSYQAEDRGQTNAYYALSFTDV